MKKNLTAFDALEISKEWIEQPMFNKVIVTLNTEETNSTLDLSDNVMSEFQYVVAKGPNCHYLELGDKVRIDLDKMMVKSMNPQNSHEELATLKLDAISFDNLMFGIIEDRLIKTRFSNSKALQTNE
jgi:hypothetical protein